MDQRARISGSPIRKMPPAEFSSLAHGQAYIDNVRERIGLLDGRKLIDALEGLDRAYDEFPELELVRSRDELHEDLVSAAEGMPDRPAILLLMYCIVSDSSGSSFVALLLDKIIKSDSWSALSSALHLLCRSRGVSWEAIKPIVNSLRQQGPAETVLQLISEVVEYTSFTNEESISEFGETLKYLLSDQHPLGIDGAVLAQVARSARHRLGKPSVASSAPDSSALLAMVERLRADASPARSSSPPDLGWPSGRMSFDEFLLQWPCEIELPVDLHDRAFIDEASRAILLREPQVVERDQYLRLLRDRAVSKSWIIEDLLASEELRSLERRLRVSWGGQVITEPGSSGEEDMPAVTWPWWSAR
jgi:hypothetical protein